MLQTFRDVVAAEVSDGGGKQGGNPGEGGMSARKKTKMRGEGGGEWGGRG